MEPQLHTKKPRTQENNRERGTKQLELFVLSVRSLGRTENKKVLAEEASN